MVDLTMQHSHMEKELNEEILRVFHEGKFINGPEVGFFANELSTYLEGAHVVNCANGTDALQIALMALNLPTNSEVIVPSFNYVAGVEAIALLGLKPVFVEVLPHTFNLDPEDLIKKITPHTSAIIAVHLFGQAADMNSILEIAKEHQLFLIEDNAQSLGCQSKIDGQWQKAGILGDIGTTSFFPTKNLGCAGDGGALFTKNEDLAQSLKVIAQHGQTKKYHFEKIGINSRLDTLQAAILRVKLRKLDDCISKRQAIGYRYNEAFDKSDTIITPKTADNCNHTYNQYTIRVANRDLLRQQLADKGIPSMVYYPVPMHLQPAYAYLGNKEGDFHTSEELCKTVLSLPTHPELTSEQQSRIIETVIKTVGKEYA